MRKSIIAGIVVAGLGVLSMGALGGALAYGVWPVTSGMAGNPNDWQGDDVWPAMIGAGVLWGVGFPLAGLVNRVLSRKGWAARNRWLVYGLVLWCWAALVWMFLPTTLDFSRGAGCRAVWLVPARFWHRAARIGDPVLRSVSKKRHVFRQLGSASVFHHRRTMREICLLPPNCGSQSTRPSSIWMRNTWLNLRIRQGEGRNCHLGTRSASAMAIVSRRPDA